MSNSGFLISFFVAERAEVKTRLRARLDELLDRDWELFAAMSSTRFAAQLFRSRTALYAIVLEASRFSRLGVRAVMLSISGSLSMSYCRSRTCVLCGEKFDFEHLLSCRSLGVDLAPAVSVLVDSEDWQGVAMILLSRFQVFVHAIRSGEVTLEEAELFEMLNTDDATPDEPVSLVECNWFV